MTQHGIPVGEKSRRRKRTVKVAEIAEFLEYLAPPSLSVPEEPYGLQVGSNTDVVRSVVVAPMASQNAMSLAASRKNAFLLTSHPLITRPMMALRHDSPVGAKVSYLVQHRTNLYVLSNSYAAAPGGFDDSLAERLGLAATSVLIPTSFEPQYKLAVFAPSSAVDAVLRAAAEAGAGRIGNYTHCSFQSVGKGTFLPEIGAEPTIGRVGVLESTDEIRIEMVVPQRELQGVIAAIMEAHPYEEVAYDVYTIKNPGVMYGRGRAGELPLQVSLETVLAQVQDALEVENVRCSHQPDFPIGSLAVASGVAEGIFSHANRAGAGAIITGGISLHDLMLADNSTTVVVDVGYSASLSPGLSRLADQLRDTFDSDGLEILFCP